MNSIILNNGVKMPQVGLGTFLIPKENLLKTIELAYEIGYRSYDTAWRYHNEREISQAFQALGIKREDIFITTKINADALFWGGMHYGKKSIFNLIPRRTIRQAIIESFKNLATDYIDLFLVHWPWVMYRDMYKELTKFYHEGKIRAIGVCSCLPEHIEALKDVSDVLPMVNQFELSPLNQQKQLIKYCQDNKIAVEAMSTFSYFRSNTPRAEILEDTMLKRIADKYNKSVAQIVLRWLIQQNVIVIPKTWNLIHLKENFDLFNFSLSFDDIVAIDSMDKGKFLNYDPYPTLKFLEK